MYHDGPLSICNQKEAILPAPGYVEVRIFRKEQDFLHFKGACIVAVAVDSIRKQCCTYVSKACTKHMMSTALVSHTYPVGYCQLRYKC